MAQKNGSADVLNRLADMLPRIVEVGGIDAIRPLDQAAKKLLARIQKCTRCKAPYWPKRKVGDGAKFCGDECRKLFHLEKGKRERKAARKAA